jgi:hypothetical protein
MTDDDLLAALTSAIRDCRYYSNTDCLDNWNREEKDRKEANAVYDRLKAEADKRGLKIVEQNGRFNWTQIK